MFGSETIEQGLVHVIPGQRKQTTLNRFYTATNKIVIRKATPDPDTDAADAMTKDERQIVSKEIMWFDRFDPKEFNLDWKFLNTIGPSVTATQAAILLEAIYDRVRLGFNEDYDNLIWNGDTTSGDAWLSPIDGIVKNIDADVNVVSVTPAGAVTAANVIAVLEAMKAAMPQVVKKKGSPVIVTTHEIGDAYDEAARALDYKGANIYEAGRMVFGGIPIKTLSKVPANRLFGYNAANNDMGEIKVATWSDADRFNVKIDRLQAYSDEFFIKVNAEVGTNHVYGKQITEYSPA
jgi:hypothetical protein